MCGQQFLRNYSAKFNQIRYHMTLVYYWLLMNTIPNLGFDLVEPPSGRNKTLVRCHSRSYVWAIVPSNCLAEFN